MLRKIIFFCFVFSVFLSSSIAVSAASTEEARIKEITDTEIPNLVIKNNDLHQQINSLKSTGMSGLVTNWWYKNDVKQLGVEIDSNNTKIKDLQKEANLLVEKLAKKNEAPTPEQKEALEMINMEQITITPYKDSPGCWSMENGFQIGVCLIRGVSWVGNAIIFLTGSILYLASSLFDVVIYVSITMSKYWFSVDAVNSAWKLVRDFSNLFFVFILLYIAIGTIFDIKGVSDPKKLITSVVIVALLVNFSGFFVRVVVDASNVIAYEFYSAMSGGTEFPFNMGTELVNKLKLQTSLVKENDARTGEDLTVNKAEGLSLMGVLIQTFMSILMILVTSIVLLIASGIFIVRTLSLLIVYIISPFAFMSQIIPISRFNYFKAWTNSLIKNAILAPGFLIPLYLVFQMLGEGGISGGKWEQMTGTTGLIFGSMLPLLLFNILTLGLVASCLIIAQKISQFGADSMPEFVTKARQMASRPLSRYGGRLAGRVGAGIAGSSVGKAAAKSWNEGGLRLVRRSWDTGALRTARESEYGKRAGQAIKNPLTTALGVQPFSVDERAKSILSDVKNLETDEQKSRFVEGLAGFRGKEEFDYIYNNMGNESVKVELAARKILADPNASEGAKKGARMVADRMAQNRGKLSGKKAQDVAAEMVKSSKGADKALALSTLSDGDLSAVYKKLTPAERIELEKDIASDATLKLRVKTIKDALVGRDKEETKREESKQTRTAQSEAALANVQQMFANGQGASISASDIRNIRPEHITDLDPNSLAYQNIATKLTTEQLQAIRGSASFQQAEKDAIREKIERAISSSTGTLPKELQRLKAYFEGNGSGF